jgi:hypothetical protein
MVLKKWKGDEGHLLPAQQVEPYRLWFEFLQLASKDETLIVDRELYARWGKFDELKFNDWWSAHWRKLFAVDLGVREVNHFPEAEKRSEKEVVVRIPLYQDPKRSLAQVAEILERYGASDRLRDMAEGQFRLHVDDGKDQLIHPSTRFLRNLPKVRLLLHIYRFWISHVEADDRKRLENTAISYFRWADGWNRQVKEKKWNRPFIEIPFALNTYVKHLEKRGTRKRISLYETDDVSDHRRQIARYIRKARKLAANAAGGRFPGKYE